MISFSRLIMLSSIDYRGVFVIFNLIMTRCDTEFAQGHTWKSMASARRELRHACTISGVWGAVVAIMVILIGPLLMDWLGPPYSEATDILLFAAMATVAQVVWVPIAHFAIMTGRASVYLKATTIALAVQQLAFLLFIPHYGVMAALFGFALSRMLSFLITFGVLRHRGALVSAQ